MMSLGGNGNAEAIIDAERLKFTDNHFITCCWTTSTWKSITTKRGRIFETAYSLALCLKCRSKPARFDLRIGGRYCHEKNTLSSSLNFKTSSLEDEYANADDGSH